MFVEDRSELESVLTPPAGILGITEGAHHHEPGAERRVDLVVGKDGDATARQGHVRVGADQRSIAVVLGVAEEGDACREQFRSRGRDDERLSVRSCEGDVVQPGVAFDGLEVGLGQGRSHGGVPEDGVTCAVDAAGVQQADEGELCRPSAVVIDRGVPGPPIDREAEGAPEFLVDLGGLLRLVQAQSSELASRRRALVDAVPAFDEALSRQTVVVEPNRIEDRLAAHAPVADDEVRLGVRHGVPDVEMCRGHVGRRCVDREDGRASLLAVLVEAEIVPSLAPASFDLGKVGNGRERAQRIGGHGTPQE